MKPKFKTVKNTGVTIRLMVMLSCIFLLRCEKDEIVNPVINSFSPASGAEGTIVTVRGNNFGTFPLLTLNEKSIVWKSATDTAVVFQVPEHATSGLIAITREGGGKAVSQDTFKVLRPPVVESFAPTQGPVGTEVRVWGKNFGNSPSVKIGEIPADIINAQNDEVLIRVTPGTKSAKISIETEEGKSESALDFTFKSHVLNKIVSALSNKEIVVLGSGHPITIIGSNFSPVPSENIVKLNEIILNVYSGTSTNLSVSVPDGITSGELSVTIGDLSVEYAKSFTVPPGRWKKLNDFPGEARLAAVGFAIGGSGYFGTGANVSTINGSFIHRKDFWEFNNFTDTWTQKADFGGTEKSFAIGFAIGNKGYLGGGSPTNSEFWEYDPLNDQWTKKADIPAFVRPSVGVSANNRGYLYIPTNEIWEYTPADDEWIKKNEFPGESRQEMIAVSIDHRVYFGMGTPDYTSQYKDFWEYDVISDQWTQKKDFPGTARSQCIAFALNGKIYVGGGESGSTIQDFEYDFWMYDPETDNWTESAPIPTIHASGNICFAIGGKGYMGLSGGFSNKGMWEFTP